MDKILTLYNIEYLGFKNKIHNPQKAKVVFNEDIEKIRIKVNRTEEVIHNGKSNKSSG